MKAINDNINTDEVMRLLGWLFNHPESQSGHPTASERDATASISNFFPEVTKVVFNEGVKTESGKVVHKGATIVWFSDGTQVIVRRKDDEQDSKEIALVYAIVKRLFGTVDPRTGIVNGSAGKIIDALIAKAVVQPVKILKVKSFAKPKQTRDAKGHFASNKTNDEKTPTSSKN